MRPLILGGGGMLAADLAAEARRRGYEADAPSRAELDLRDTESIERAIDERRLSLVINAAAFTRVDDCESEVEHAMEVNGHAVERLGELTGNWGLPLVQVSSDYVFDGRAREPYDEDAPTGPASVYGRSKELGERGALSNPRALVVRSSWLFGAGGANFVRTMHERLTAGEERRVVDDQVGCPTYTPFLAAAIFDLVSAGATGLVHYANPEPVSWFGFASAIGEHLGRRGQLEPCTTAEFPRPAPRPAYSVLDCARFERLVGRAPRPWREGLEAYLQLLADGET